MGQVVPLVRPTRPSMFEDDSWRDHAFDFDPPAADVPMELPPIGWREPLLISLPIVAVPAACGLALIVACVRHYLL